MFYCFVVLLVQVYCFSDVKSYKKVRCMDNQDTAVDWWYMYKPPIGSGGYFDSGRNYTYLTPHTGKWIPADEDILSFTMLQRTLTHMVKFSYKDHLAILADLGRSDGNTKESSTFGLMLTDDTGGIWLGHTIPGFPKLDDRYPTFPEDELDNGHLIMCMSLDLPTLNLLASLFKEMRPTVQLRLPTSLKNKLPVWQMFYRHDLMRFKLEHIDFLINRKSLRVQVMIRQPNDLRCIYRRFAMKHNIILDIYGHTAQHTPTCEEDYGTRNINYISLKFPYEVYYINNSTDKMKFAVSTAAHWQRLGSDIPRYWACINMEGKFGGGGLIICVDDYNVWWNFDHFKIIEPNC